MEITQTHQDHALIFALSGRLDAKTAAVFEQQLLTAITAGNQRILLDFSSLDYISSAGLRVLLLGARKLQEGHGKLALSGLKPSLKTVFDIAGFSTIFSIFASREEALAALSQ